MQVLLLFAVVLGMSNAFNVNVDNIERKLRLIKPILMMGEELFQIQDKNQCYEKAFCLLETMVDNGVINPLTHFSRYLTNSHFDIEPKAFDQIKSQLHNYPRYTQIINSILFGRKFNSTEACAKQFSSCDVSSEKLISTVKALDDENVSKILAHGNVRRDSKTCTGAGIGCGLVGGGCTLCTAATEGACGVLCGPEVGAACSGVGLGCIFG